MRFQWSGSTWTTGVDDTPSPPVSVTMDATGASIQRTFNGTARYAYRFAKRTMSLQWSSIGTNAPDVYIRNMIAAAGTVEIAYHGGTMNTYVVPGSLSCDETGYCVYDIAAQFAEI